MKFFTYRQNNTGGSFEYNAEQGISTSVIIEAESADKANEKAEAIGLYWNGVDDQSDCECCGDRWYPTSDEGDEVPSVYGMPVHLLTVKNELMKWNKNGYECFVHYADGKIVGFYK
jgi:hypothetical protein